MMATSDSTGSIEQPTTSETFDGLALDRMMVEARIKQAKTRDVQEFLYNILFLLERGDIRVYADPLTGELLYKAKELN